MILLETLKCQDGVLYNLAYHQRRFDAAREHHFPGALRLNLSDLIRVPEECRNGLFRCRVQYSKTVDKVEFLSHRIREVRSLKLVKGEAIEYPYKYSDRKALEELFEQRAGCDDILIVKDGCITDSFYANPVFFDGSRWWTSDTPLLPGTQRARLLAEGRISMKRITVSDLSKFEKVGLINALQDMEEMPVVSIEAIERL